ncbi:MAG TPA: Bax inhibitor-1 family protein [Blastocatellia bacterium]
MQNIDYADRLKEQAGANKALIGIVLGALVVSLFLMRLMPEDSSPLIGKVMVLLAPTLATASAGAYVGRRITGWLPLIGLFLVSIVGLFIIRAAGGSDLAIVFLLGWGFVNGMILGPLVGFALASEGPEIVVQALVGTTGVMLATGFIGIASHFNFSFLLPILFLGLIGLIIVGLVGIFVRFSRAGNLAYSAIGMVVFAGYFLWDFSKINNSENTWPQAIALTTRLYLDFANFFIFLLRFLMASRRH